MDILTQTITLGSIITIGMFVLGILNYNLNKKKEDKTETQEEVKKTEEKLKKEQEQEARLISIEKDTQYIRLTLDKNDKKLDKIDERLDGHESRISKLEAHCKKRSTKPKTTAA